MSSLIELNPAKVLAFDFSSTESQVEEKLVIQNTSDQAVAFKVKTTAPKAYLVRPSSDLLRKGQACDVQIILQPSGLQGADPTSHRFLVQVTAVGQVSENLSKEAWSQVEKSQIQEFKLAVADKKSAGGSDNLQKKYDELVAYIFKLEQETLTLQEQLKTLKEGKGESGYAAWHMILAVILCLIIAQIPRYL